MTGRALLRAIRVARDLAVVILCGSLGVLALKGVGTLKHVDVTLVHVDDEVNAAQKATDRANLLMKQAEYPVLQLGLASAQVKDASMKEAAILDALNARVQSTLGDLDHFVVVSQDNETALLSTAADTVRSVQPALVQAQIAVEQLTLTERHIDSLVEDPAIPATLQSVQRGAAASADSAVAVKGTAQDVQQAVHSYLHPTWMVKTADWTLKVVHAVNPF